MKRKRRKKLKQAWMQFQSEHDLPDEDLSVARAIGFPLPKLQEKISHSEFASLTTQQAIHQLDAIHQQQLAERRVAIAAGTLKPKVKKSKSKKFNHDPAWVKAKKLCRLSQDDIQKAKELGLTPKTLMKNNPAPTEQWKLPVKQWIHELYERKTQKKRQQSP